MRVNFWDKWMVRRNRHSREHGSWDTEGCVRVSSWAQCARSQMRPWNLGSVCGHLVGREGAGEITLPVSVQQPSEFSSLEGSRQGGGPLARIHKVC